MPSMTLAQAPDALYDKNHIFRPRDYSDVLSLQRVAPIARHSDVVPAAPQPPLASQQLMTPVQKPVQAPLPQPQTVAKAPVTPAPLPAAVPKAAVPAPLPAPVPMAAAMPPKAELPVANNMQPLSKGQAMVTPPVPAQTVQPAPPPQPQPQKMTITWDEPAPAVSQPSRPPVAPADPAIIAKPAAPVVASDKQKLGSINEWNSRALPTISAAASLPAEGMDKNLQISLLKKIEIIEKEKENLRKKLNMFDPGGVGPVYQCAAETTQITALQNQVAYLVQENQSLKKKNEELGVIPRLPGDALGDLPAKTGDHKKN